MDCAFSIPCIDCITEQKLEVKCTTASTYSHVPVLCPELAGTCIACPLTQNGIGPFGALCKTKHTKYLYRLKHK